MKYTLILLSLFFTQTVAASFYMKCTYEAELTKIERLSTINVETQGNFSNGSDNYTYVMHLKLSNGVVGPGSHTQNCDEKLTKAIFSDKEKYQVGNLFKVSITNANSRNGSFSVLITDKPEI